jgi:hypothetical protein
VNALGTGFAYIGFGIMVLCICHGCTHCQREELELKIREKQSEHIEVQKEAK